MNEFIDQFIVECRELIAQATDDLIFLEEHPENQERLDAAFRAFHTLKGSAGIVEFAAMERTLHIAENILSSFRSSRRRLSPTAVDESLACLDLVGAWLDEMQSSGELPPAPDRAAEDMSKRLADSVGVEGGAAHEEARDLTRVSIASPSASGGSAVVLAISLLQAQIQLLQQEGPDGAKGRLLSAARTFSNVIHHLATTQSGIDGVPISAAATPDRKALIAAINAAIDRIAGSTDAAPSAITQSAPTRSLRIGMNRIDALVRIVSELVVTKNSIGHLARHAKDGMSGAAMLADLQSQHAQLDRTVSDLQNAVLGIRVLPIGQSFRRFPRVVREIASTTGKSVRLTTEGESTEADAAIVELLFEPLLHVVRNAIDHGIEGPAERKASGKNETGTIALSARREQESVIIEIKDDGRGVDVSRVRDVARERNLVSADVLDQLGRDELVDLIFAPGFSTATQVTELSGRGVGMDSVRDIATRLGGRVSMTSHAGQGATVRLVLPFTLLMTRLMTVEAADQIFGLPLDVVVETVLIPRDRIVPVRQGAAFVLRDRTIPLLNLAETLGLESSNMNDRDARVVVALSQGQLAGLEVERFGERMNVMLKPMDGLLKGVNGIAGTTLLGDGRVLIVLDVPALFSGPGNPEKADVAP